MDEKIYLHLQDFADDCIQCGECLQVCSWLDDLGLTPGEIAEKVVGGDVDEAFVQSLQRCALCGLCSQMCAVDLNPAEMFQMSREVLVQQGKIVLDDYDLMQVDRDWHYFSLYRSTYEIKFNDLYADQYDTLFFPGCTLASYAPELTRTVHAWLQQQGYQMGFTEMCCGKPLASIGLEKRAKQLLNRLQDQMQAAGATRLVTACPNCLHTLGKYLEGVELISLYDLLNEAGVHVEGAETLTVHDSCPDRYELEVGPQIRQLLSGHALPEMEHHGSETICCGSGGIVSMIDPELSEERAHLRMDEFDTTGAERCVTACMACAYRLARAASPEKIVHCLELVFDQRVDLAAVAGQLKAMWEGEWGEYNQYRLTNAKIITGDEEGA
ncbi:(Fe-S)-binding protein [bacterium]|nr:(Fe-S)-binding protein [bacterium]